MLVNWRIVSTKATLTMSALHRIRIRSNKTPNRVFFCEYGRTRLVCWKTCNTPSALALKELATNVACIRAIISIAYYRKLSRRVYYPARLMVIQIGSTKHSFASALAQILNSFQNLLPIIYIIRCIDVIIANAC